MKRHPQVKVPHNLRFDAELLKQWLGIMGNAWSGFIQRVRKMTDRCMTSDDASLFFKDLFIRDKNKELSTRSQGEHKAILALFSSAPGQELSGAKGTLWGAVNAVSYYVDHVRAGTARDRLNSVWFGVGSASISRCSGLPPASYAFTRGRIASNPDVTKVVENVPRVASASVIKLYHDQRSTFHPWYACRFAAILITHNPAT